MDNTGDRNPMVREIPVNKFDCTVGTDRTGDTERRVVIMVATDSVQNKKNMLELEMARRKGAQDANVVHGMPNCFGRLGPVKAKLECDHAHINDGNFHGIWQGYARRQC